MTLNTATFHLLVNIIMLVGEKMGLQIANNNVDQSGKQVSAQYNMDLSHNTPITLIFYHTSSTMLLQLKGVEDQQWDQKIQIMASFVDNVVKGVVTEIEKTQAFVEIKQEIQHWVDEQLNKGKSTIEQQETSVYFGKDNFRLQLPHSEKPLEQPSDSTDSLKEESVTAPATVEETVSVSEIGQHIISNEVTTAISTETPVRD